MEPCLEEMDSPSLVPGASCLVRVPGVPAARPQSLRSDSIGSTQLARRAGTSQTQVSRIERGVYDAPARTIKSLTDALGRAMAAKRGAA